MTPPAPRGGLVPAPETARAGGVPPGRSRPRVVRPPWSGSDRHGSAAHIGRCHGGPAPPKGEAFGSAWYAVFLSDCDTVSAETDVGDGLGLEAAAAGWSARLGSGRVCGQPHGGPHRL
jgi:hypothetical protein